MIVAAVVMVGVDGGAVGGASFGGWPFTVVARGSDK